MHTFLVVGCAEMPDVIDLRLAPVTRHFRGRVLRERAHAPGPVGVGSTGVRHRRSACGPAVSVCVPPSGTRSHSCPEAGSAEREAASMSPVGCGQRGSRTPLGPPSGGGDAGRDPVAGPPRLGPR